MADLKVYKFDMERLSLGELEIFEDVAGGFPDTEEALEEMSKSKLILAAGLICLQREDPTATIEDARKLEFGQIEMIEDPS